MYFHSVFVYVLFLYIPQPVILKELKQEDGDFTEDQRIELNTVRETMRATDLLYRLMDTDHTTLSFSFSVCWWPYVHLSFFF